MGKGDRKTAKGKRYVSSYGNARKHAVAKAGVAATATALAQLLRLLVLFGNNRRRND